MKQSKTTKQWENLKSKCVNQIIINILITNNHREKEQHCPKVENTAYKGDLEQ